MAVVLSKSFSNCFDQVQKACTVIERGKLKKAGNILYSLRKDAKVLHRECEKYQSSLRRFEEQKQRDIEEMSSRINDLYNQERDLEREKSELCVQRTALKDRKQIEHRSLQDAQQSYYQAETNRQNEQEEVDHLNRWWWVPIYGQILAVRELIEDHSGQARKAAADMALYQQRIEHEKGYKSAQGPKFV